MSSLNEHMKATGNAAGGTENSKTVDPAADDRATMPGDVDVAGYILIKPPIMAKETTTSHVNLKFAT